MSSLVFKPKLEPIAKRTVIRADRSAISVPEYDKLVELRALLVPYEEIVDILGRSYNIWHRGAKRTDIARRISSKRNQLLKAVFNED